MLPAGGVIITSIYLWHRSSVVMTRVCLWDKRVKKKMCSVSVSYDSVTFPCSRLDVGNMMYSTRQGLFVIDLRYKNIFDTKNTGLVVWLRPCNALHAVMDWNGHVEKTWIEWHIKPFVSWLWYNGWKYKCGE